MLGYFQHIDSIFHVEVKLSRNSHALYINLIEKKSYIRVESKTVHTIKPLSSNVAYTSANIKRQRPTKQCPAFTRLNDPNKK